MSFYNKYPRDGPNNMRNATRSWPRVGVSSPGGVSTVDSSEKSTSASAVGGTAKPTSTFGGFIFCLGIMLAIVVILVYLTLGQHSAILNSGTVQLDPLTAFTLDHRPLSTTNQTNEASNENSAAGSDISARTITGGLTSKAHAVSAISHTRATSGVPQEATSEPSTSTSMELAAVTKTSTPESPTVAPTTSAAEGVPTTASTVANATAMPLHTTKAEPKSAATARTEVTVKPYECATRDCKAITTDLVRILRHQTDPCRSYNTYVCDASEDGFALPQPSAPVVQIGTASISSLGGSMDKPAGAPSGGSQTTYAALKALCLAYGDDDDADLGSVLAFLSVLKLNLTAMRDDADEDPLQRAMQLSLEFDVHSLLTFQRVFEYVVDASEPFRLEISVSSNVRDFAADWVQVNRDVWPKFFEYCLSFCGLHIGSPLSISLRDELISLDAEVAELLSAHTDPVTKKAYLESPSVVNIDDLAAYTRNTVSTDRWRQLLTEHARAEFVVHDSVLAYPRALKLADLLSHPRRRLAMRRLVAWHLLLFLLGPKRSVLQAYQEATYDAIKMPGRFPETTLRRCETVLVHTGGVRGVVLSFFDGTTNLTYKSIAKAGNLMASIQNAATRVLQHNGSSTTSRQVPVGRITGFPQSAWSSGQFAPFWVLDELGAGFLRDWLSTLRSWYVLPPIVQAHTLLMAGVVPVDGYFYKYFQPPHFYEDGLAAYNYASLGQVVAHGLARHIMEDLPDMYREKWYEYWARNDMTSINYMYCLHASNKSEDAVPPAVRLQEDGLKGSVLEHSVATRLAFLAFADSPQDNQDQLLPRVDLPPAVLFFVFHCAYSCRRVDSVRLYPRGEECMVVFQWTSRFTDIIPCGRDYHRKSRAQCRYL